jgi:hypothetical protein
MAVFTIDLYIGFGLSDNRGFRKDTEYAITKGTLEARAISKPLDDDCPPRIIVRLHERGRKSIILLEFTADGYDEIDAASTSVQRSSRQKHRCGGPSCVCPNVVTEPAGRCAMISFRPNSSAPHRAAATCCVLLRGHALLAFCRSLS